MKETKSEAGETEMRPNEYAPDGPVRLAPNAPDSRGRLNGDGSKSKILAERPVYLDPSDVAARLDRLERAVMALEKRVYPMLTRSEPGPIDLDRLVHRVKKSADRLREIIGEAQNGPPDGKADGSITPDAWAKLRDYSDALDKALALMP